MKKKTLIILVLGTTLLLMGSRVSAQTITPSPVPTGKFGEEVRELREQNQEERKNLIEQNKNAREKLREDNKAEREDLREENKTERELLRENSKNLLKGKTPEEKLTLIPTIQAERKALKEQNKIQIQEMKKIQWDSKKSLTENIQTNVDSFRQTVRDRWTALWASFGKK